MSEPFKEKGLIVKIIRKVGKAVFTSEADNHRPDETEQVTKKKEKKHKENKKKEKAPPGETKKTESIPPTLDEPPPEQASGVRGSLEEKHQLEQSIAGVVGGPTGLLAALDVMVYDTKEKNPVGFRSHAKGYFWRLEQLQSHLKQYQEIAPEELESMPLYRELLVEGDTLREMLEASDGLTDDDLDKWREKMLQHIHLYVDEEEADYER